MNANKLVSGLLVGVAVTLLPFSAFAVQGLGAQGNAKVNNAVFFMR